MNKKIAKFAKNLNDRTRALALDILGSPTKLNLLQFYKANPFSIHTPRGLANILGRTAEQVYKEAEALATAGVLKKISENEDTASTIYSYEPDKELSAVIDTLVELSNDPKCTISDIICLLEHQ